MFVCCVCCVLCRLQPLRRADHSFRAVLMAVCDLETSTTRRPRPELDSCAPGKEKSNFVETARTYLFRLHNFGGRMLERS
jgi:hypothetical protein